MKQNSSILILNNKVILLYSNFLSLVFSHNATLRKIIAMH